MSIKKMSFVVAGAAMLLLSMSAMAQDAEAPVPPEEAVVEEEAAPEETAEAAPPPAATPAPEPVVAQTAAPAPVPEPPKAEPPKPGPEFKFYGAAQYRFRGRLWTAKDDSSKTSFDYLNLYGWHAGVNVKIDDQLSLQIQIGNDWGANEPVQWSSNNTTGGGYDGYNSANITSGALTKNSSRTPFNNLYVHLANATWNPGYLYLSAGVIGLSTSGALDLLERSLSTGSYNEAIYQTWAATANSSVIGVKLGVPLVKEGVKVAAELTTSIIEPRTQSLITSVNTWDDGIVGDVKSNPTSVLLALNVPIVAGDFKVTPEFVSVINRNYNSALEKGDHEILGGLALGYKVSPILSVSASGAYGQVSNENSKAGGYRTVTRSANADPGAGFQQYDSKGWFAGVGGSLKAGPGTFALDVKYQNSVNDATDALKDATNIGNLHIDPRYTIAVHPKFSITPRWRFYLNTYEDKEKSGHIENKIENRPELMLTGTF